MGRGPIGTSANSPRIDGGTTARSASPLPGPLGSSAVGPADYVRMWGTMGDLNDRAEEALAEAASLLKRIPRAYRARHQLGVERVERARSRAEQLLIDMERQNSPRVDQFDRPFAEYQGAVMSLDVTNRMWDIVDEAWVAIVKIFEVSNRRQFILQLRDRLDDLIKEAEKLEKLLQQAKSEVTSAQWQRGINAAIGLVAMLFPPARSLKGLLAVTAALTTASVTVDAMLGPEQFDGMNTAVGSSANFAGGWDKLSTPLQKAAGVGGTLYNFISDSAEVDKAKAIVKRVEAAAERLKAATARTAADVELSKPFMAMLDREYNKFVNAYKAARGDHGFYEKEYQRIQREEIVPKD